MRMLRVEMRHGDPLQRSPKVPLGLFHDIAGQPFEVEPFAELRRDNDLPKTLVTGLLPVAERLGNIDLATRVTEASRAGVRGGAPRENVPPGSPPLPFHPVRRVTHANGTPLVEGPTGRATAPTRLFAGARPCR